MVFYGSMGAVILLILCNLSLKLTLEGTADRKQGALAVTGQFLFLHFHKAVIYPWDQPKDTTQPSPWLPMVHRLHSSHQQERSQWSQIGQSFLRGIHVEQLTLHGDLALNVYPYAAVGYGICCALLGALDIRRRQKLPLTLEIAPAERLSFFYAKSIIKLTPAHIIIICLRIAMHLASQAAKHTFIHKGRRAAYHERASYQ